MDLPVRIFVYGVPGSGKTSFTRLLAGRLGCPLIEADALRGQSEESGAFGRIGTTDAWKHFGDLGAESVYAGLLAVRGAMQPYVQAEIDRCRGDLIAEAAFLDPAELRQAGDMFLMVAPDEKKHQDQFFVHRRRDQVGCEGFRVARILQAILVDEAGALGIRALYNSRDVGALVSAALADP